MAVEVSAVSDPPTGVMPVGRPVKLNVPPVSESRKVQVEPPGLVGNVSFARSCVQGLPNEPTE